MQRFPAHLISFAILTGAGLLTHNTVLGFTVFLAAGTLFLATLVMSLCVKEGAGGADPARGSAGQARGVRFSLRTLLIAAALLPPIGAGSWLIWHQQVRASNLENARVMVANLRDGINLYTLDLGTVPPDLDALLQPPPSLTTPQKWAGPYLDRATLPLDPWNHAFEYEAQKGGGFRVWSVGPDMKSRTSDDVRSP